MPSTPEFFQSPPATAADRRAELAHGLMLPSPQIAPKFLYDALGSRLFEAITELHEYYPTRTEAAIFERHPDEMAAGLPASAQHAGGPGRRQLREGRAAVWRAAAEPLRRGGHFRRLPARRTERAAVARIRNWMLGSAWISPPPGLAAAGRRRRAAAVLSGLQHRQLHARGALPPSCAGRVWRPGRRAADRGRPGQAGRAARSRLRRRTGRDRGLQPELLRHVNRLLGSDFDVRALAPRGLYNAGGARIEMHLEAARDLRCAGPAATPLRRRRAHPHRELLQVQRRRVRPPAAPAGYTDARCWTDPQGEFALFVAH